MISNIVFIVNKIFPLDEAIEAKEAPPKQPKRTYQRKNLSNDEIMRRSPLFKDLVSLKKGRTGAILNAGNVIQ